MSTNTVKHIAKPVTALALALLGSSAFAVSTWDNLGSSCNDTSGSGNTLSCGTKDTVTLSATAWSTAAGTSSAPLVGTTFAAAAARNWGSGYGLGVCNVNEDCSSPQHTVDNNNGTDVLELTFSKAVSLSSFGIGWMTGDADVSVLAWTGTGTPGAVNGKTLQNLNDGYSAADFATAKATSTLLTSGWQVIGNYSNVQDAPNDRKSISTNVYSSYWLVSAYNKTYGGGDWTSSNDYFKLLSVAGSTCSGTVGLDGTCGNGSSQVPEPGSLALLGIAMAGFVATRRRKQKAA